MINPYTWLYGWILVGAIAMVGSGVALWFDTPPAPKDDSTPRGWM